MRILQVKKLTCKHSQMVVCHFLLPLSYFLFYFIFLSSFHHTLLLSLFFFFLPSLSPTRSRPFSFYFLFFIFFKLIYLFLVVLGLSFCARAFSSCGKRGPLFIAVRGPLTVAASPVAEHRLQTRRLSNCGSRAQLLCGMWNLPRPGLKPMSPALASGFSTTVPPGKPCLSLFKFSLYSIFIACSKPNHSL